MITGMRIYRALEVAAEARVIAATRSLWRIGRGAAGGPTPG